MHTILIIDDSRAALRALCMTLNQEIFAIHTADSAVEALETLKRITPDCILIDYEMPETDGPALCKTLRNSTAHQQIPIIVFTSKSSTDYLLAAINAGADDFIPKDLDVRIIHTKIAALIRNKKFQDELAQLRRVAGIRQIIATYNHEFNNPLTIAIGNLTLIRKTVTDNEALKRIQKVHDALERMAAIVKKIRDLRDYVETNYTDAEQIINIAEKT